MSSHLSVSLPSVLRQRVVLAVIDHMRPHFGSSAKHIFHTLVSLTTMCSCFFVSSIAGVGGSSMLRTHPRDLPAFHAPRGGRVRVEVCDPISPLLLSPPLPLLLPPSSLPPGTPFGAYEDLSFGVACPSHLFSLLSLLPSPYLPPLSLFSLHSFFLCLSLSFC